MIKALVCVLLSMFVLCRYGVDNVQALASPFGDRTIEISDNRANVTADYQLQLAKLGPGSIGSVKLEFCSNTAIPNTPCTAAAGFNIAAADLTAQTGVVDFNKLPTAVANNFILTRVPDPVPQIPVSYTFSGVANPLTNGTYYARIYTYSSVDATGTPLNAAGIAISITNTVVVSTTVPPYLTFCTGTSIPVFDCASATGDYVDFGELSSTRANAGQAQMMTTTNASGGYSIRVAGTTLTSGNNVISPISGSDVSRPGIAQFGLNLRNNTAPFIGADPDGLGVGTPATGYGAPNSYRFNSGDVVATAAQPDLYKRYTISYIVNVPKGQSPGIYVTTLTYICLANF